MRLICMIIITYIIVVPGSYFETVGYYKVGTKKKASENYRLSLNCFF